ARKRGDPIEVILECKRLVTIDEKDSIIELSRGFEDRAHRCWRVLVDPDGVAERLVLRQLKLTLRRQAGHNIAACRHRLLPPRCKSARIEKVCSDFAKSGTNVRLAAGRLDLLPSGAVLSN